MTDWKTAGVRVKVTPILGDFYVTERKKKKKSSFIKNQSVYHSKHLLNVRQLRYTMPTNPQNAGLQKLD